ncbi:MAG: hypothetical protein IJ001_01790 [Oscillospiraceae bacterium]|nr:hypothetical protein [Oscillospiraceae bacterium]
MRLRVKLFDIFIFLITLLKSLGARAEDPVYVIAFIIGCFSILIKMLREQFTRHELISVIFIIIVGTADFILGNATTVLFTAIAICGTKNIDKSHVVRIVFWTRLIAFFALISLSAFGIIENEVVQVYRNDVAINRYMLGHDHPNMAHMSFAIIVVLMLYLYGEKMRLLHYCALLICNLVLYKFTYSRTGVLLILVSILFDAGVKNFQIQKLSMRLLKNLYIWEFVLTLFVALAYGRIELLDGLNKMLTGRVWYMHTLLTNFAPPIFGSMEYNQYVNIDNGYISLLYQGGILAFVWFSYYVITLMKKLYVENRVRDFFLVINFIVYSFTESFFPAISINISLLFLGEVIFQIKPKKYMPQYVNKKVF